MQHWLSTEVGLGLLRSALLSAGTWFVSRGLIDADQKETIVAALVTIVSVILSAYSNRNKAKVNSVIKKLRPAPDPSIRTQL